MALTKIPSSLLDTSGGFDLQGNITLGDSERIQFGDGTDFEIYSDGGSNNYLISNNGALILRNLGDDKDIYLQSDDGSGGFTSYIHAKGSTGEVILKHYGSNKIATSSTGATVTGNLAVTGDLDITGNVNSASVTDLDVTDKTITLGAGQTEALSGGSGIIIDGSSASILWDETNTEFDINNPIHVAGGITFGTSDSTLADNNIMFKSTGAAYIDHNTVGQDINFRISNASALDTTIMTLDAGVGSVGINQPSPSSTYKLDVGGAIRSNTAAPGFHLRETDASNQHWTLGSYGGTFAIRDVTGGTYPVYVETGAPSSTLYLKSSGNVGIGTTSPLEKLDVRDYTGIAINSNYCHVGSTVSGAMAIFGHNIKSDSGTNIIKSANTGYHSSMIKMYYNEGITFHATSGTATAGDTFYDISGTTNELMRITNSGNLLVGKTSTSQNTAGTQISSTTGVRATVDGNVAAILNRTSSNGDIVLFRKDGATAGKIGVATGPVSYIVLNDTTSDNVAALKGTSAAILPSTNAGADKDGVTNLGSNTARFNNFYLSGGAYLGGTAAANALDDYEEGTWTPALVTSGGVTTTSSTMYGIYTKIGNICHIHAKITATLSSLPGQTFQISGLPFTSISPSDSGQRAIIAIGGDTLNLGGNAIGKAHFRTNGTSLQGVYLNSGSTAYWTYNTMDSTSFELNIHGFYTTT